MRMGSGLALRIGAVTTVLKAGNRLAESPVGQHSERCGTAAVVVGDKGRFPGEIDGNFARAAAARGNRIDGFQGAPLDRKGGDRTALFPVVCIHLVDGVKMPAIWGEGQEAGVDGSGRQSKGR